MRDDGRWLPEGFGHDSADPIGADESDSDSGPDFGDDAFRPVSPHAITLGDPHHRPVDIGDGPRSTWRDELRRVGGPSPLLHFVDSPRTRIDLSTTHPGGLAKFITGRSTLLSSLIRDDLALRAATVAAGDITQKGAELATARGIDSVQLGIGLAEWRFDGEQFSAPVLLRPLAIRRYGRDFELRLRGVATLNPELARALSQQFQVVLDARSFAALAESDGSFTPNSVIDRLRGITGHLEWFNVQPRLLVSSFADVGSRMVEDAADLAHPVLDALAGIPVARERIERGFTPAESQHPDARSPETDSLLLDADSEQDNVIAQIAAGTSLVVETLPGTGGTQTIVNAIGSLVQQNKRVLVVGPRRQTLLGIAARFDDIGLPGFAVSPTTLRRDLITAINRNEKAEQPRVGDVDDALVRLRKVLLDYRGALFRTHPELGVSALDCLRELSRLSLLPDPPTTTVRLSRGALATLAFERDGAAAAVVQAARLGEFKYGPGDSPWYGADFATSEEATEVHELARRLHRRDLPRLLERAAEIVGAARMRPFTDIAELGVYLRLLTEIRDTLDRFRPEVFERSLSEYIAATGRRRDSSDMTGANRRRLKAEAKDFIRPGVHISDLHGTLERIQDQRRMWQRYVADTQPPEIPSGVGDLQVAWQQVDADLEAVDRPLDHAHGERLVSLPIGTLVERLGLLAEESDVLSNLQERVVLRQRLRELQLDDLMSDLSARRLPAEEVAAELELSWWRSALESLLADDQALLNANTRVLDRLEADFRSVDAAHAAANGARLAWQLAKDWLVGIVDRPEEADALRNALRRPTIDSRTMHGIAPGLSRTLAPVWLASPYDVDRVADEMAFDTVILVDAGAVLLAESVNAIRRATQVVAFGDPVTQTPADFRIAVADAFEQPVAQPTEAELQARHSESALARLGSLLPTLALTRSYRAGGEDLAALVNERYYDGRIESLPWAGGFLSAPTLQLDYVADGQGLPDSPVAAVESVDAEVDRVVELVLDHATHRARESLMVVSASSAHVLRVQQAVLAAIALRPELGEFILDERPEPFTVMTIDQAVAESRDRVIFSVGYGRTPHGRVLSDLGPLGHPGGDRLIAVAMTRARRSMMIVTCFHASDLDTSTASPGVLALHDVLGAADRPLDEVRVVREQDPMLVDLARRLRARGLRVALDYRGRLPLVAASGSMCLTVRTDGGSGAMSDGVSLRESLRLRPELLRLLGWHYLRVHAFQLFTDPDSVADTIATMLGVTPSPRISPEAPHSAGPAEPDATTAPITVVTTQSSTPSSSWTQSGGSVAAVPVESGGADAESNVTPDGSAPDGSAPDVHDGPRIAAVAFDPRADGPRATPRSDDRPTGR